MRRSARLAAALVAAAVVVLDQASKLAVSAFVPERTGPLIPVTNTGLATGLPAGSRITVIALGVAVAIPVAALVMRRLRSGWARWLVPGLMLGGALSNLLDRVALGGVRDFLAVGHVIVVNAADLAVLAGVALFAVDLAHGGAVPRHQRPASAVRTAPAPPERHLSIPS